MPLAHEHNLVQPPKDDALRYGIRLSIPNQDPFTALIGGDWEKFKWFATEAERDTVLADMARQHEYSRSGDKPSLIFEKVLR